MNKKWMIPRALVALLLCSSAAYAEGRYKMIEAFFERINFKVNGQQVEMSKDSIIYDGSIYIPIRNLTELLGAQVGWDNTSRTVNLDFILDKRDAVSKTAKKSLYQYIAMQNNLIMNDLIDRLKKDDFEGIVSDVEELGALRQMASDMKDDELTGILDKLKMSLELLRSGLASKKLDDYNLAWSIFSANEKKLIDLLQSGLVQK